MSGLASFAAKNQIEDVSAALARAEFVSGRPEPGLVPAPGARYPSLRPAAGLVRIDAVDRRNFCRSLSGACLTAVTAVHAQAPKRMWRIGYVGTNPALPPAFQQAMERLGYVNGKTAVFRGPILGGA